MTGYEREWLNLAPPHPASRTTLGALAVLGSALLILDLLAAAGGSSPGRQDLDLAIVVAPFPLMLWWAHATATRTPRRPIALLASAATVWVLGLLSSYASASVGGAGISAGIRSGFLATAQALVVVALVAAIGSRCSLRLVVLDTTAIAVPLLVLGALLTRPGIEIAALPSLSTAVLGFGGIVLIFSAALRSSAGVPLWIGVFGLAEIALTAGNLITAYAVLSGRPPEERWAGLAWAAGAIVATLAAGAVLLGIDQPVRLPVRSPIPDHAAGARPTLLLFALGLTFPLGIACDGVSSGRRGLALAGLIAGVTVSLALALRARESLRTAEAAYRSLDRSLAASERARDELVAANRELSVANVQSQAMQVAFAGLLKLADERTDGRLRQLIEETGDDLAVLLEERLERD